MRNIRLLIVLTLFLVACLKAGAQQTLRGKVYDSDSHLPLVNASVVLSSEQGQWQTNTDTLGQFRFEEMDATRYVLELHYLGYETFRLAEVLLSSGKETVLQLELRQQANVLEGITVTAKRQRDLHPLSVRSISLDEIDRFPATFFDPARHMSAYAGIVAANEQGNHLSVRGNSPTSLAWYLEGVQIVNPNHLSNAGTFSDRASFGGGGINMLSAQLLDHSRFWSGAFPAEYGNVLGGVMDMRLRPGNRERKELTAQVGLLGIDLAAEGPLGSGKDASYLVNYRYSTLGLLSAMGVTLGDEDIRFQDLAFHIHLPEGKKGGRWSLFGMGGRFSNQFEDSTDVSVFTGPKETSFVGEMGALGVRYQRSLNERARLESSIVWSGLSNERREERETNLFPRKRYLLSFDRNTESRLGLFSALDYRLSIRSRLRTGIRATAMNSSIENGFFPEADYHPRGLLLQPFGQVHIDLHRRLELVAGVHAQFFSFGSDFALEPRASLSWKFASNQRISFASGMHSQLQTPVMYARYGALDFTRALHTVLGYQWQLTKALNFQVELYYQHLYRVPSSPNDIYSAINLIENYWPSTIAMQNIGQGNNYGIELSLQRYQVKGWYFLANTTLFRSNFRAGDGVLRLTRFDARFAGNLVLGKEFAWSRKEKARSFGLSLRSVYVGGQPKGAAPFDRPDAARHPAMYRIDVRIYGKWQPAGRTHLLAIDLINTNNRVLGVADVFHEFSPTTPLRVQTGLVPLLSYRINF